MSYTPDFAFRYPGKMTTTFSVICLFVHLFTEFMWIFWVWADFIHGVDTSLPRSARNRIRIFLKLYYIVRLASSIHFKTKFSLKIFPIIKGYWIYKASRREKTNRTLFESVRDQLQKNLSFDNNKSYGQYLYLVFLDHTSWKFYPRCALTKACS